MKALRICGCTGNDVGAGRYAADDTEVVSSERDELLSGRPSLRARICTPYNRRVPDQRRAATSMRRQRASPR